MEVCGPLLTRPGGREAMKWKSDKLTTQTVGSGNLRNLTRGAPASGQSSRVLSPMRQSRRSPPLGVAARCSIKLTVQVHPSSGLATRHAITPGDEHRRHSQIDPAVLKPTAGSRRYRTGLLVGTVICVTPRPVDATETTEGHASFRASGLRREDR